MERTQRIYLIDDRTQEWQRRTTELPGRTRQLPQALVQKMQREQQHKTMLQFARKLAVGLGFLLVALAINRGRTGLWLPSLSGSSDPIQRSSRIADVSTQRHDTSRTYPGNDEPAHTLIRQRSNMPSSHSSPWVLPLPRYGSVPPPAPTFLDGR